jgi:predicted secreted protein
VTLGELFEIGLVERPTTGFRWRLVEVPDGIELVDTAYLASPDATGVGGDGQRRFRLCATRSGKFALRFVLIRSWESAAREEHNVEIEVTA